MHTQAEALVLWYFMEGALDDTEEYFHNMAWEEQVNLLIGDQWTSPRSWCHRYYSCLPQGPGPEGMPTDAGY